MSTSKETFNKREKEKARQKKKLQKQEKREDRKSNLSKGKSLDQMLAYVDENGNLSSTPPIYKPSQSKGDGATDGQQNQVAKESIREGVLTRFDPVKGYGFIRDKQSRQSVFVHQNELIEPISENDRVIFEIKTTPKGASAIQVKKQI
ncbi:cold-shock protein [Spirosoma aerolatum]|uniref:cold-shock protein n=1 Tax=Spirosoma aerolatum TaxID=1211326 RepID=UPI0009ACB308|nr:cold shock domain-containing protein [Spirosoma aerolatum]